MSNDSLIAFSGTIVAGAVSILWLLMHCTLLFGFSQSKATHSEERIDLRYIREHDAA